MQGDYSTTGRIIGNISHATGHTASDVSKASKSFDLNSKGPGFKDYFLSNQDEVVTGLCTNTSKTLGALTSICWTNPLSTTCRGSKTS